MLPPRKCSAQALQIVEALESDIIFGRLRPHQELVEDVLIARFGAKRHVVRSALQELIQRQIVIKPYSRSARVKDFTIREVEEIYFMRALLQREAVRIMPLPADPAALDALKAIHARYVAAVETAPPERIHQLNDEFHAAIFDLSKQTELCRAIAFYKEASNPIRSYGIVDKHWLQRAVAEHGAMIEALDAMDRTKLEALVVEHMQPTRRRWEAAHPNI